MVKYKAVPDQKSLGEMYEAQKKIVAGKTSKASGLKQMNKAKAEGMRRVKAKADKKKLGKKVVSKAEFEKARNDMKKILTSKTGAIKRGTLPAGGKAGTAKAVSKEVPTGFIAVVNNKNRKFARMPMKAFKKSLDDAGLTVKQKADMLKKVDSKDREVFTANKKILDFFKIN